MPRHAQDNVVAFANRRAGASAKPLTHESGEFCHCNHLLRVANDYKSAPRNPTFAGLPAQSRDPLTYDRSCLRRSTPCFERDLHLSQVACELLEIVCRRHSKGIAQGEHRAPGMGKDTVNGAIASEVLESWPLGGAQNDQACVHLH